MTARLQLLPGAIAVQLRLASDALATGDLQAAQAALGNALARAPGQPDVLRLYGLLLARIGNFRAAFANFETVLRTAPDDAMGYWQYAQIREEAGDLASALRLRELAVQRLPESPLALADLGEHLERHRNSEQALEYLERSTRLAPDYAPAQLKLGDALVSCGRIEEGAAAMRKAIAMEPAFAAAWLDLVDIKTVPITDDEVSVLQGLLRRPDIDGRERTAIQFALAKVYENRGEYAGAYALFVHANARRKQEVGPWDAGGFLARVRRAEEVFAAPHAAAEDPRLGREVIFIVGLPRSGTTLVEQVLASHPHVQGTGERGELAQVLAEESARRQRHYPDWAARADARDWQRLGRRYLDLSTRFHGGRAHFTDKMPNNWQALGAIRAMLPGARIVTCRREPLENCWSCFKQFFARGWEFTYDIDQLATFWKAFDRAASHWAVRDPAHVREQYHEALTQDPRTQIPELLEFCGVPFDPACLAPHAAHRSVHTLSAAQVRTPIRRPTATAAAYGTLLDPLRSALGLPTAATASGHSG
ncbi:MAG TPA: sulfotransferase [Rhodanobacteraceae bacterium]|nr:sulfotransferase [Rhodanobacteraceae bacterium]